jgi:hypothetical protein
MHGIESHDFLDTKRVSITFRQSGGKHGVRLLPTKGLSTYLNVKAPSTETTNNTASTTTNFNQLYLNSKDSHDSTSDVVDHKILLKKKAEVIEIID